MVLRIKKSQPLLVTCATFILAFGPMLDPYALFSVGSFTIKLLDIPMLIVGVLCCIDALKTRHHYHKDDTFLLKLQIVFVVLSMVSFFAMPYGRNIANAIKNCAIESVYIICVMFLWGKLDREGFTRLAVRIAIWNTVLLVLQYVFVTLGFSFYDGRLPLLEIGKYEYWAPLRDPNTGDVRVHAMFQEPSYYGMYVLPVFAHALNKKKYKMAVFFAAGLVLSSSLVAVLGACIIFAIYVFLPDERGQNAAKYIRLLGLLAFGAAFFIVLYTTVNPVRETVDYALTRILGITDELNADRMGSAKHRLLGHLNLFANYLPFFKAVGVGANQFSAYLGVNAYSNVIVSTLLNYGIAGLSAFLLFILTKMWKASRGNKIYVIPLLVVCFSDYQWMNWYFFYLITWFIRMDESAKMTQASQTIEQPL